MVLNGAACLEPLIIRPVTPVVQPSTYNSFLNLLSLVTDESGVFTRERSAGIYRLSAFYLARTTTEIPTLFVLTSIYTIIVYWMSGLMPAAENFFAHWIILILQVFTSQVCCTPGVHISGSMSDLVPTVLSSNYWNLWNLYTISESSISVWMKQVFIRFQYSLINQKVISFKFELLTSHRAWKLKAKHMRTERTKLEQTEN